jgi:threonyl-tRNA synthetase
VFPLWLCPEQVRVIPVSENFMAYADKVCNVLKQNNIRAKLDIDNNSLAKKIRNAELMKVYYIIVV